MKKPSPQLQKLYNERDELEREKREHGLSDTQGDRLDIIGEEIDELEILEQEDARWEHEMYPERFDDTPCLDPSPFDGRSYPAGY